MTSVCMHAVFILQHGGHRALATQLQCSQQRPDFCSGPRAPTPAAGAGNVKAVRAQLELADQDCTRISAPDYTTPFQSLEDAVDRLLPFHIFGAEDPQQTDVREVAAQQGQGAVLATARAEAWADFITHKAGAKPMSAADAKAKQLAALAARINQRK
ncbi:hypothetical protein ABPG75_001026 [Micractinium tetrahymenae]